MWQHCNRHHGPLHPGLYCGNTTLPIEILETKKKIRDYSNFNANRFLSELQEIEWSNLSDNDANKSFTTLLIAQIFNVSVSSGSFPAKLKTAKVVPVFKSGDESKPGNYRPISLLSIFNRIFEKLVYKRLIKFVNQHNILYSSQYGFRSRHSTQHATLEILNDIRTNFDKGHFTFCLFIDLKKAFDTVNYDTRKLWLQRSDK